MSGAWEMRRAGVEHVPERLTPQKLELANAPVPPRRPRPLPEEPAPFDVLVWTEEELEQIDALVVRRQHRKGELAWQARAAILTTIRRQGIRAAARLLEEDT
jgi:hypothetical protein